MPRKSKTDDVEYPDPLAGIPIRTLYRIRDVEATLAERKVFKRVPSRAAILKLCKEGTLEFRRMNGLYYVFEDSLFAWIDGVEAKNTAA